MLAMLTQLPQKTVELTAEERTVVQNEMRHANESVEHEYQYLDMSSLDFRFLW